MGATLEPPAIGATGEITGGCDDLFDADCDELTLVDAEEVNVGCQEDGLVLGLSVTSSHDRGSWRRFAGGTFADD